MPDIDGFLPLPPATFHILLALAEEDRHGYAIIQDVEARTGGELRLSAGTLYRSVQRMLEQGLIVETRERPAPEEDDERRRVLPDLASRYRRREGGRAPTQRARSDGARRRLRPAPRIARPTSPDCALAKGVGGEECLHEPLRFPVAPVSEVVPKRVRTRDARCLRSTSPLDRWYGNERACGSARSLKCSSTPPPCTGTSSNRTCPTWHACFDGRQALRSPPC